MSSSRRHFAVKRSPSAKNESRPSKRSASSTLTKSSTGLRGRGKYLPNRHFPRNAVC